ncbi:precorrin-6A reductase [Cetobacterium sp. 2A]|uniref:precorrin-6A reductase n=1 Tax=Cetobacterium sp. 2A TaxID=2754723 RepID=UPI00163CFAFA|nr:precorrin-6A reductase [Cetobacterium sp. 2A]MBC2855114.1 precorrin-6A reductase [Cetobacterium sp. 2A]
MIWIIGGTKDSRDFIESFPDKDKLIVTTATEYGGKLLEDFSVKVFCKRLLPKEMEEFIENNQIKKIVDLSHPYAVEVSQNAMNCAKIKEIEYVRFERVNLETEDENAIELHSVEDIVLYVEELEGNILVTLGSNNIEKFSKLKNLKNIYFRILPKWEMVKKAEDSGILPRNIIAQQGPFSYKMNLAQIEDLNIKYVVSKKGGDTGGEKEKIEATKAANAVSILLTRPSIIYPCVFETVEDVISHLINKK